VTRESEIDYVLYLFPKMPRWILYRFYSKSERKGRLSIKVTEDWKRNKKEMLKDWYEEKFK